MWKLAALCCILHCIIALQSYLKEKFNKDFKYLVCPTGTDIEK